MQVTSLGPSFITNISSPSSPNQIAPTLAPKLNSHLFPFDQILQQYIEKGIYSKDFTFNHNYPFPDLPGFPSERIEELKNTFLKTVYHFEIISEGHVCEIPFTFAELLSFEEGKNRLFGSFVKYLLSSLWFKACIDKLHLSLPDHPFIKAFFEKIDTRPFDIDLQHINTFFPGESEGIFTALLDFISLKSPLKAPLDKMRAAIQQSISGRWDVFFYNNKQKITCEARRIPLKTKENQPVDLVLAKVMDTSHLLSPQDLFIDLNPFFRNQLPRVDGTVANGWKAFIDSIGRIYEFHVLNTWAWGRSISYNTSFHRHPKVIDPQLYTNLFVESQAFGGPLKSIPHLLKIILKNHHNDDNNHAVALLYNALITLQPHENLFKFYYSCMHTFLEGNQASGFWTILKDALKAFPFPVVAALVELTGHAAPDTYITQHNGAPALMRVQDGVTLLQPHQPHLSIQVITEYLINENDKSTLDAFSLFFELLDPKEISIHLNDEQRKQIVISSLRLFLTAPSQLSDLGKLCLQLGLDPKSEFLDWKALHFPENERMPSLKEVLVQACKSPHFHSSPHLESLYLTLAVFLDDNELKALTQNILNNNLPAGLKFLFRIVPKLPSLGELLFDYLPRIVTAPNLNLWMACAKQLKQSSENHTKIFNHLQTLLEDQKSLTLGASLLLLCLQEGLLPQSEPIIIDLWLLAVENTSKYYAIHESLRIWKKGGELSIYPPKFHYQHRRFLINYCERLFSSNIEESTCIAHEIIEAIPQPKQKDDYSERMTLLVQQRNLKLQLVHQKHQKLCEQVKSFEISLKAIGQDTETSRALKQQCETLLDTLFSIESLLEINRQNLIHLKHLLCHPKVQALFEGDSPTFLRYLHRAIENAARLKIEEASLPSLIELHLQKACPDRHLLHALHVLLQRKNFVFPSSLNSLILTHIDALLKQASQNNLFQVAAYIVLHFPLNKETEHQAPLFAETMFWCIEKLVEQAELNENFLKKIYYYILDHNRCYPELSIDKKIGCYTVTINALVEKKPKQAFAWVGLLFTLLSKHPNRITEITVQNISSWSPVLLENQQWELLENGYSLIVDHSTKQSPKLLEILKDGRDYFALQYPHIYAKIEINSSRIVPAKAAVINAVARILLTDTISSDSPDLALSLLEGRCKPIEYDLEPIFRSLTAMERESFRTRAFALITKKYNAISEQPEKLEDIEFCKNWLEMLRAIFLIPNLTEQIFSKFLFSLGFDDKVLTYCIEKHALHKPAQKIFECALKRALKEIVNVDAAPILAKSTVAVLQKDSWYENIEPYALALLPKLFTSSRQDLIYAGGLLLHRLFALKGNEVNAIQDEVKLLPLYLKAMNKFPLDVKNIAIMDSLIRDFILLRTTARVLLDLDYEDLKPFVTRLRCSKEILPLAALKNHFFPEKVRFYSQEYSSALVLIILSYFFYKYTKHDQHKERICCGISLFVVALHLMLKLSMPRKTGTHYV